NTFLTILLCCFGAVLIALSPYRWWNDVIAALVFCGAALTVESGLLVWVIFAGAALVGARGVSRRGQLVLAVLFVGYFGLRFLLLDVGVPGLEERSSGYGFSILEPDELIERFGDWPFGFYVYNVITSFVSVLVAEPRAGVFRLTSSLVSGTPDLALAISSAASLAATTAIALFAWRRRHALLARRFDRDDQLVLIFGMVLVANAVISYPYTKDVIMSPAGA